MVVNKPARQAASLQVMQVAGDSEHIVCVTSMSAYLCHGAWDDAPVVVIAKHGVCLAAARLAVRKDAYLRVQTAEHNRKVIAVGSSAHAVQPAIRRDEHRASLHLFVVHYRVAWRTQEPDLSAVRAVVLSCVRPFKGHATAGFDHGETWANATSNFGLNSSTPSPCGHPVLTR
jgi:hypothetical protein